MKKVERSIRDMQSAFFRRKETQKKRSRKQPRSQKTKGRKVPRAKRSSKTRHSNEFDFDGLDMGLEDILSELSPLQRLLLFLIIAVGLIYAFWNTPAVQKAVQTLVMVGIVTIVALLVGGVGYLIYSRKKEKEMVEKGYVKYVNADGKEVWGTPEEAERMSYYNQVVEAIREFKPARGYQNERYYQYELYQWLKAKFKDVRLEEQRGSSRPDIVVGDIAIEVKGPTGYQDLQSIADKLVRYPEHFSHVIVVLFDVTANPARYDDWKRGLKKRFPEVSVIRKDSIER